MINLETPLPNLHVQSLKWFQEHTLFVHPGWPTPFVEHDFHIVNKAKGIHKPKGSKHALSVRISADNYSNSGPDVFSDKTWKLLYHQELRSKGGDPKEYATNHGLLMCMADQVPVGILKQLSGKPAAKYMVFGLGLVTDYSDGFFIIEGPANVDAIQQPFEGRKLPQISPNDIADDDRQRSVAEVVRRRGQGKFRKDLLAAYSSTCAVTGCKIVDILDAAHILPHTGSASNHIQNGILLRTDIHTLFDLGLLKISPDTLEVSLSSSISRSEQYASLSGTVIRLPAKATQHPSSTLLRRKFE